jgi:hypothetical protein
VIRCRCAWYRSERLPFVPRDCMLFGKRDYHVLARLPDYQFSELVGGFGRVGLQVLSQLLS